MDPSRRRHRRAGVGDVPPELMGHCGRSGISRASYARRGGFDSRSRDSRAGGANRQRSSLARRRLRVRIPRGPPTAQADVAQLGEARRSDRRQCGFESRRQYDWTWRNGSAPALGAGGWRFESSRPDQCEVVEVEPRLALNQEVRVRTLASQPTPMSLRLSRSLTPSSSACGAGRGSFGS